MHLHMMLIQSKRTAIAEQILIVEEFTSHLGS